jgi:aspartyl-tRNA(Asn)/glutamyl-tRNA(Gln) amidotransferase subunit A
VPDEDATVVARLRAAGAIVLGKLNMHEFAYGPEGLNGHYGHPWNPWDPRVQRIAGGSSSGSAIAIAAGLCAGTLGSDTGGSIRLPSALCNVTGLKPTYGRVSRAGVLPLAWSMDNAGPMTRTARDAALLLGAIAGADPRDPTARDVAVPDYVSALTGDVRGLRVGLLRPFFLERSIPPVRQAVEAAAATLAGLGAAVEEVALDRVEHAAGAFLAIVWPEALAYHRRWLESRPGDYTPAVRDRLRLGFFVDGTEYVDGQRVRRLLRDAADRLLERVDVLLAPAAPIVASPIEQDEIEHLGQRRDRRGALILFTQPFNLTGHPAAVVPCGFDPEGMPIGLQIVGRAFDEATVLRVADAFQRATDFHARRPPAVA